ncbi:kinetochore protein NDC80 homolog [Formica exsecta]|uniref:kinetochore protein NDC80 homolog n=1 Tax=Formica exsecta TaxID=72781 RepID=UPI001144B017|nr:kinetochore protein NDC80 homolog [Formica exsecta]
MDQRRTLTLKPKRVSTGDSHIPRPRFRNSSSDRAGSTGRKSYLKSTGIGKPSLHLLGTPVTPARVSTRLNVPSSARSEGHHTVLPIGRSPSGDRASNAGAKGPRKDTRPLGDKSYQMDLLNKIDNFFHVNQRSNMLNSNGSLKPITLNIFVEVSNFLLKLLDIKQDHNKITTKTYIEEIPKCAKKLHYPGMISKSWLKTANVPHSWPNVLGWIGWLVEACQVREFALNRYQLETLPFVGTEQQAQSNKLEFIALLECYKAWNDEKLDEEAELLEKYRQDIINQKGISEEDIVQAQKELDENNSKLEIIEEESREIDEIVKHLSEKLSSLRDKEEKQLDSIKATEDYIRRISAETNQLNAERDVLNEQFRMGKIQHKELISIVKDQPMSKYEKEKIVKECTEIQNYIHGFDEHLTDYQKELYSLDIKFAASNNDLNKAVLAYNKEIFMHTDNDIDVNFDELKLPEKGLLNPQIIDIMKEKVALMDSFKELLAKQCNEVDSRICSETIKLEKLQEEIKFFVDEDKLKEEKSCIDKMKIDMKNKKIELTKQIEVLKNEIKKMQDTMSDIQAIDLEIEEAKDKLNALTRRQTFLEQSAEEFFDKFYKIIGEHRSELYDILTRKK